VNFHPPNWKLKGNYPDPSSISNEQLAWEFLRRNSDYSNSLKVAYLAVSRNDQLQNSDDVEVSHEVWERLPRASRGYPLCVRRFLCKWRIALPLIPDDALPVGEALFIDGLPIREPRVHELRDRIKKRQPLGESPLPQRLDTDNWLVLDINLNHSKEVLVQEFKKRIAAEMAERKRAGLLSQRNSVNPALLVQYLRLLDARSAGAKWAEIREELRSWADDESGLKKAFETAKDLSDRSYLALARNTRGNRGKFS
jgi:hypothetical protein